MDIATVLAQAKTAIQNGQRDQARQLLAGLLREHPESAQAWLWMSGVVNDPAKRRQCLQRVLALDPDNAAAQHGLELLDMQTMRDQASNVPPEKSLQTIKRLGEYLVDQHFITPMQLKLALEEQERERRNGRMVTLGDVLLRHRWLSVQALTKVLAEQQEDRKREGIPAMQRLGEYLVKQDIISEKQLEEVIARQAALKRQGRELQLGELLVLSGMVSRQRLEQAIDEHQKTYTTYFNQSS